jgi:aspartate aminotransferase
VSATLAADERIRRRLAAGEAVVHMAFGEAGLPVHPAVAEALARGANENGYGPVAGRPALREAVAGYFERRRLPTRPDQVVAGPGSKALLYGLLSLLPGDVVLPRPSWVSYAAQAALAGKRVWLADIGEAGGVPDPGALADALTDARVQGGHPGVLVLTLPDNPTGTLAPASTVQAVCRLAEEHDLAVVSDEIYRDLAHDPDQVVSPAELVPERAYVTSGLSKSLALGGWRIGFVRLPVGSPLAKSLPSLASEIWSSLAAPMQQAAAFVLEEPQLIRDHVAASRRLHRLTALAVHRELLAGGVECRAPQGGFYLYPDFEPLRARLTSLGVHGSADLSELLLDRFGVGTLAGEAFADRPERLRLRLATSLLYGASDAERWQSLAAVDPADLPSVRSGIERLGAALSGLSA